MNCAREIILGMKLLVRDYRAGELTLIALAIVVAVASVTTVGFFTDRVQRALDQQANRLLGADLVLSDTRPLAVELGEEARQRGLAVAEVMRFPSMAMHGDASLLCEVRAVTAGYPLRGEVRIASELFGADRRAPGIPEPGTVWVDERLYTGLGLDASGRVALGAATFRVAAILTQEPGVSVGFLSGAPRVLMNAADLPATGLVQPGSRIRYQLQIAGTAAALDGYRAWARARLAQGVQLEGIRDARPEIRSALERAERYLDLAALAAVLLAAVAIALAARRYLRRHLDGCAVMRCLGASQGQIVRLHLLHFTGLGTAASAAGCAAGILAQALPAAWLERAAAVALPLPAAAPALYGLAVGLLLLLGFALPPLAALGQVPMLRVLRRELGTPRRSGALGYGLGAAAIFVLVLWRAQDLRFGLTVLGWAAAVLAAACALAWAALRLLVRARAREVSWRLAQTSLGRRRLGTVLQVVALGLGIMALLVLTVIRNDLLRTWRESLPPDAPDRFVINIQPDQIGPLGRFFTEHGLPPPEFFPMVRGRLVSVNGRSVSPDDYADERARRLASREFNLSWALRLQRDNRLVAGRWWEEGAPPDQLSVERGLAQALGIRLGDRLVFDVAGTAVAATVTSLRRVEWDSFNVNFFVVSPPGLLESFPATYVTSFRLPAGRTAFLNALVARFPNVVVIDVAQALAQLQGMMAQAARGVQFVFLFTLAAGLVVLYAAIAVTQDERLYQAAVLRTLGAKRAQLDRAHLAEFGAIGALAGFVAASGAAALGAVIARRYLQLDYVPDPALWLLGVACGALGVAIAGWLGTRRVLDTPPLGVLRTLG
jgi:putative ABC transport system permease protein